MKVLAAGMHASISSHIVNEYLLDEARGIWGPNLPAFQERLGNEAVKERIENLYFAYLFVLRAVMKAGPLLESVSYSTGTPTEDARTFQLIQQLVRFVARPTLMSRRECVSIHDSGGDGVCCRLDAIRTENLAGNQMRGGDVISTWNLAGNGVSCRARSDLNLESGRGFRTLRRERQGLVLPAGGESGAEGRVPCAV